jgi:hypothetical protein
MLNLKLNDKVSPTIVSILTEFRRSQVSRFPIEVEAHENDACKVRFVDSRFPNNSWRLHNVLAKLDIVDYDKHNKPVFQITCRLINNEKYVSYNELYNTKETSDPKKLLKLLKDYVKPYSAQEIAHKSYEAIDLKFSAWTHEPSELFQECTRGLTRSDIAEEVIRLKMAGVQFHTEKFQRVAEEGLEHYYESKRRASIKSCKTHVLVQPDSSVVITTLPNGAVETGNATYENMETVPVAIQQAVAMLRMVEANTFVPETGMKVSDNRFWVEVNPEEFNYSNT